ncbi:alpha/beta fold hydrolase [Micromonospora sp. DT81.3]|uniref:alpha/beta fold hydrolase n=1 Tax=Actinomycetes TaxID=1760 RepID=UPI003CEEED97
MVSEQGLWYADEGSGPPLVVLHPGGTDSRSMTPLLDHLDGYRRITIDRPGHGRSADTAGAWSFADMADSIARVLRSLPVHDTHVVGWSDGAIVGLHLTLRHPDLIRTLVFGGAPRHYSGWRESVLEGDPPQFMADAYAEVSPDGAEHWDVVVRKSAELHRSEPRLSLEELSTVTVPVLILSGDDDEVRFEHLIELYEALPDGELAIVPRSTHALIVEKPDLVARLIRDFHAEPRQNGFAPIRRADRRDTATKGGG